MTTVLMNREARMSSRCARHNYARDYATFLETPTIMPTNSEDLYRKINRVERGIGGDAGIIGMSGSVARLDLDKILHAMAVDSKTHFLDVGSGLGRPMLHALQAGAAQVSGVEFDMIKHRKSQTVIDRVLPIDLQIRTCVHHNDILALKSLAELDSGISHIFSFWEGINIDAREAVGRLVSKNWQAAKTVTTVAFVQSYVEHLDSYMKELYFPGQLRLVESFPVSMIGSAAKFRAYIFKFPASCDPKANYVRRSTRRSTGSVDLCMTLPLEKEDTKEIMLDKLVAAEVDFVATARPSPPQQLPISVVLLPDETLLGNCIIRKRKLRSSMQVTSELVITSTANDSPQSHKSTIQSTPVVSIISSCTKILAKSDAPASTPACRPVMRKRKVRSRSLPQEKAIPCNQLEQADDALTPLLGTPSITRSSSVMTSSSSDLIDLGTPSLQKYQTSIIRLSSQRTPTTALEVINIAPAELCDNSIEMAPSSQACPVVNRSTPPQQTKNELPDADPAEPSELSLGSLLVNGEVISGDYVIEPRRIRALRSGRMPSTVPQRRRKRQSSDHGPQAITTPSFSETRSLQTEQDTNHSAPSSRFTEFDFVETDSPIRTSTISMTDVPTLKTTFTSASEANNAVSMSSILQDGEIVLGDYVIEPRTSRALRSGRLSTALLPRPRKRKSGNLFTKANHDLLASPTCDAVQDREVSPQTSTEQCMTTASSERVRADTITAFYGHV